MHCNVFMKLFFFCSSDSFQNERKVNLTHDGLGLVVMERSRGTQQVGAGDTRKLFDLHNNGALKSLEQQWGQEMMWIQLFAQDR